LGHSPPNGATAHSGPEPTHYNSFTVTLKQTTLGGTPLNEGSARRRDFYLSTRNTHNRQTSMPQTGFEPTIPKRKRLQTNAVDLTVTTTAQMHRIAIKLI